MIDVPRLHLLLKKWSLRTHRIDSASKSLSENSAELVLQALLTTTGVVITRWMGDEPIQEKRELEHARQVVADLPRGAIERRFFEQLTARIETQLTWMMDRPSPQSDGRDW